MNEPIETIIIRGQQKFDLHDVLNPIQIKINDDQILNILKKKYENVYCKLTPVLSSITNNTKQIFITCRELYNVKTTLINGNRLHLE